MHLVQNTSSSKLIDPKSDLEALGNNVTSLGEKTRRQYKLTLSDLKEERIQRNPRVR